MTPHPEERNLPSSDQRVGEMLFGDVLPPVAADIIPWGNLPKNVRGVLSESKGYSLQDLLQLQIPKEALLDAARADIRVLTAISSAFSLAMKNHFDALPSRHGQTVEVFYEPLFREAGTVGLFSEAKDGNPARITIENNADGYRNFMKNREITIRDLQDRPEGKLLGIADMVAFMSEHIEVLAAFLILHELGHWHDALENPDFFGAREIAMGQMEISLDPGALRTEINRRGHISGGMFGSTEEAQRVRETNEREYIRLEDEYSATTFALCSLYTYWNALGFGRFHTLPSE